MKIDIFLTKCLHISIIGFLFLFLGIIGSINLNKIYPDNYKNKKVIKRLLIILLFTSIIYIFHYLIRIIIKFFNRSFLSKAFFWKDSIGYEFSDERLNELNGGIAIAFAILLFMQKYKEDLVDLFENKIKLYIF